MKSSLFFYEENQNQEFIIESSREDSILNLSLIHI